MIDKSAIVHDLAMVYAKEKFQEFLRTAPAKTKETSADASQLCKYYCQAVTRICAGIDEIDQAYLDDDGNPLN